MIKVENLRKQFGQLDVLKGINLELKPGMITAIVGENGAGKSTLFKCIAGLESYKGTIDSNYEPLKNYIGFLPTNPQFLSKITAKEYLHLVCNARKVTPPDFEERNIFNLPLNRYADDFSTGMKKKLALTGVLHLKNEVFLLDEPFNGVDIQSNILFNEILKTLKKQGKTIILSSHIFSAIHEVCDYIYYLEDGKIAKQGNRDTFMQIEDEIKQKAIKDKLEGFFD